jgi:cystathionine beta-lyase/cystathionine gamma-synthase
VAQVFYPGHPHHPQHEIARRQMRLGFGPLVAFEVKGGVPAAERMVESLRLILHAPSLGGVESLVSMPIYTSHQKLSPEERARAGIPEATVRLSIGIEDVDDLWDDLEQALARTG